MAAPRRKKVAKPAEAESVAIASELDAAPEAELQPQAEDAVDGAASIKFPADVTFAAAAQLHADLLAVRESPEVVLDASGIEKMSTAGVLVLLSFLAARSEMKPPAAVLNPPGAFVDAFSELGLFDKLMSMEFRT